MNRDQMRQRVKVFGVQIIRLCETFPNNNVGWVLGKQLLKSGTSLGANYHEALRSSSQSHFVSIVEIALREACETKYWLELLREAAVVPEGRLHELDSECEQLIRIPTATARTAKQNLQNPR